MKYALVTGGSRGIGKAISLKLAEQGYHILLNYRSQRKAAEEALSQVQEISGGELMAFDVSSSEEINKSLESWQEAHPDDVIEILVNNAGIRNDKLLIWMEDEDWKSVLETNLYGAYHLCQAVIKSMIINKYGRIINMVSLSGLSGLPGQANYSASKAGLIGLTKSLAQEVGKKKITVNAVAPGYIRTEMTAGIEEKEHKRRIPMQRFGTPEEVADLVSFLASPKASYITGEVISINGGLYT